MKPASFRIAPLPVSTLFLALLGCSPGPQPPAGHDDSHEPHEEEGPESVRLTDDQVAAAGIRLQATGPGEITRHLTLPAVVAANADAVTHVNPKAPGIVRSIEKQLGTAVREGELLCRIDSAELGAAVAAFVRERALVEAGKTTLEREGRLFQERLETAERVLQGAIDINRRIQEREQELQSQAVSTIRPLLEAERTLQASELEKERALTDLRAERDTRLLVLEVELEERRIGLTAAINALSALGLTEEDLADLEPGSPLLAGTYEIRAPRPGIVAGRHITTGEFVDSSTKLYTLEDLTRVWVVASAFETQIPSVRTGQSGRIRLDAFPGLELEARVTLVGYEVDASSRALGVRLELDNPTLSDWPEEYPLRPGMFGGVDLVIARERAPLVLAEGAIVHAENGDFVFVRTAPGTFERREVRLGPPAGENVAVLSGLAAGEEVAVSGTFHLESALRKGELGGGHSH